MSTVEFWIFGKFNNLTSKESKMSLKIDLTVILEQKSYFSELRICTNQELVQNYF